MSTISTIDRSSFGIEKFIPSSSCIKIDLQLEGNSVKCNCPYCNQEVVASSNFDVNILCKHLVNLQLTFPIMTLSFDEAECTIFRFDEIQNFVSSIEKQKVKQDIIRKLNSNQYDECIATEWELVIMNWLAKFGICEYENPNSKGRKPDINWKSNDNSINFTADVKTLFDQFDRDYPVFEFCSKARTIIDKHIPKSCSSDIRFESKEKPVPTIFPKNRFDSNLELLEEQVINKKDSFKFGESYTFVIEGHELIVKLITKTNYTGMGYRAAYYNQFDKNPLYNGLLSKSEQLISDNNELLGIFLCDGNTCLLNPAIKNFDSAYDKQIIPIFFKEHIHIDFVVTFSISPTTISYFKFNFYINQFKEINEKVYALQNIFMENINKMSKHKDTPHAVIQKIQSIANNEDQEMKSTPNLIRKKFK